jgi:hypothetical protein
VSSYVYVALFQNVKLSKSSFQGYGFCAKCTCSKAGNALNCGFCGAAAAPAKKKHLRASSSAAAATHAASATVRPAAAARVDGASDNSDDEDNDDVSVAPVAQRGLVLHTRGHGRQNVSKTIKFALQAAQAQKAPAPRATLIFEYDFCCFGYVCILPCYVICCGFAIICCTLPYCSVRRFSPGLLRS